MKARVKAVHRLICSGCEELITKCSLCGKWFEDNNEPIECKDDGLKHICKGCSE